MKPVYYDQFSSYEDLPYGNVLPKESDLIYAGYSYEDYEGSAIVVFKKDGKLYENNDCHCSCNGLDNWDPEETSIGALRMRESWPGLREQLDLLESQ